MNRLISWFVRNPVASNLLMLFIVVGGLSGLNSVSKTVFPSGSLDTVQISVSFPGANPGDVEERILIPVEEAISDLEGIKRLSSTGFEGRGQVNVDAIEGYDVDILLNEIKARVDAINTFPTQSERPVIRRFYAENQVMFLILAGDIPEVELKELGRDVRDRIAAIPGAEKSSLDLVRDYEISIEVSEFELQKFGLTFSDVAQAIRRSSLNVGAGMIDGSSGQTQLMTRGQAYQAADFQDIVIVQQEDGNQILLQDVAEIIDGFEDGEIVTSYDNLPTILLAVIANENPDVVALSREVSRIVEEEIRPNLPDGVKLEILLDNSEAFKDRLSLLAGNGLGGLLLVFLGLTLFLTPRLAIWVTGGICIAFLGCFWMLPYLGIPLSMLSTFAFVLILGIVVDDAVIIGESIHRKNQQGMLGEEAAIAGATMVAKPVIFSALTTMLAFSPLLFILGATRTFVIAIPLVVIVTLLFSLLESFCILPRHLVHRGESGKSVLTNNSLVRFFDAIRHRADAGLQYFIQRIYRPFLDRALRHRLMTLLCFLSVCFFIISFSIAGRVQFTFNPNVMADFIFVQMDFPPGTPLSIKEDALNKLESAYMELEEQLQEEYPQRDMIKGSLFWTYTSATDVRGYLAINPSQTRDIGPEEISRRWRELTPVIPEAKDTTFQFTINENNPSLNLVLSGTDPQQMTLAGEELKAKLASYRGVYEVVDSNESASSEAVLSLLPGAENLNVSLSDLATQVRQAFYGEEVQRVPRGRDTVRVMVRLPEEDRSSFDTLQELRIRTGNGQTVPFDMVADVDYRPGVTRVTRTDRERTLRITAKVDESMGNLEQMQNDLNSAFIPDFRNRYPGTGLRWAGSQEGESEFMNSLSRNAVFAMFAIFFLLAVAFRSYMQPLIIMTAIPCGYVGAVLGHLLLGQDISIYSILGIVAAAGVVVNDNLVLMDYINRLRDKGYTGLKAVERAAEERFRPIFLTSFTTFIGLVPLMSETSVQAQFMIPTVISLAFGVLFATTVTLLLVPVLYLMLADFQNLLSGLFKSPQAENRQSESAVAQEY